MKFGQVNNYYDVKEESTVQIRWRNTADSDVNVVKLQDDIHKALDLIKKWKHQIKSVYILFPDE